MKSDTDKQVDPTNIFLFDSGAQSFYPTPDLFMLSFWASIDVEYFLLFTLLRLMFIFEFLFTTLDVKQNSW